MKSLLKVLVLLSLLVSCGHNSILSQSNNDRENILYNESMSRHSDEKLNFMIVQKDINLKSLGQCYSGSRNSGLKDLKDNLNENIVDERYWNSIGVCYYLKKDYKKAAFFYKLSLQVAKSNGRTFSLPYNNMALIYTHTRQYNLAFEYFSKAIKLNSRAVTAKFNLSQLYLRKYLPNKALPLINELLEKAPNDIELQTSLGLTYLMSGKTNQALDVFTKLPKSALERQDIASYTALAYFVSGKYLLTLETLKNQETATLKSFRVIAKKLKELANAKVKQRGQS